LEVNGKTLAQSHAIHRYIAKMHGLAGKDAWEAALCDQFVDATGDLLQHYRSMT
jgi:glutathione S-transferase